MESTQEIKTSSNKGNFYQITVVVIFALLTLWWITLRSAENTQNTLVWAASYQALAIFGAIFGFLASSKWGGLKSLLGRALFFFALGLTFQVIGQSSFSYYNLVLQLDIPYPSIADIGYFGSIPFYIYASYLLMKVSGGLISLKANKYMALVFLIPVIMLVYTYNHFLQGYEFEGVSQLQVFLDFAYPLGQAIYVSLALLTYLLSIKYLGGILKYSILIILIALVLQYLADYNFLYQALNETWVNGGYGDYLYLVAYFVMAIGLIRLNNVFDSNKLE